MGCLGQCRCHYEERGQQSVTTATVLAKHSGCLSREEFGLAWPRAGGWIRLASLTPIHHRKARRPARAASTGPGIIRIPDSKLTPKNEDLLPHAAECVERPRVRESVPSLKAQRPEINHFLSKFGENTFFTGWQHCVDPARCRGAARAARTHARSHSWESLIKLYTGTNTCAPGGSLRGGDSGAGRQAARCSDDKIAFLSRRRATKAPQRFRRPFEKGGGSANVSVLFGKENDLAALRGQNCVPHGRVYSGPAP